MIAAAAAAANFPVPLVVGARFALEPGRGRSAVPVRSALVGAVAGVLGVLAAFTFSAGVSDAASHPERFGQTWQLTTFFGYNGQDSGPAGRVLRAVAADRDVTGVDDARIGGGQSGHVSIESYTYAPVGGKRPVIVLTAGRMPARADEIVLAPTTAQDMHARTGSVVRLAGGTADDEGGAASPASASFPRGRTTGTRTGPGSRRPGTTGSSAARATRSSSMARPCRSGRARTWRPSRAGWTPRRRRSTEEGPSSSRHRLRSPRSRRSRTWNCCRSR